MLSFKKLISSFSSLVSILARRLEIRIGVLQNLLYMPVFSSRLNTPSTVSLKPCGILRATGAPCTTSSGATAIFSKSIILAALITAFHLLSNSSPELM